jgi:small-conductance mechanosensitive channel
MRLRLKSIQTRSMRRLRGGLLATVVVGLALSAGAAWADEPAAAPPAAGWIESVLMQFEAEAAADIAAAPEIPTALDREWRSFNRNGSAGGALVDLGWVALAALVALLAEKATAAVLSRRPRRRMRSHEEGPSLVDMLAVVACDVAGLAVFMAVFAAARRHFLADLGVTITLMMFAANVLIRWRIAALIIRAVLRPNEPAARLIEIEDREAVRLYRVLSITILAIILLVGFGRYGLMDEDSGAAHVIGLLNAVVVCGLYVLIVFRARDAAEALIRGRRTTGVIAAVRTGIANAWTTIALTLVAGLLVFFVAGLSLGLLGYYHAVTSSLGIWFVLLVLERLTERVWGAGEPAAGPGGIDRLRARTVHRIVRVFALTVAAVVTAWVWIDAIDASSAMSTLAMRSTLAAAGTLFIAFVAWELVRFAVDRNLQDVGGGPSLPGDDDELAAPASRLQTILPLLRAAFGVAIGVVAALIVLSRLGVDTAPLIAGAGVFGLAVSFGSQSLVRDIISGLFYMWDDAFRVGEYIDTGRLKGTVETLGIRSVKLRHQNGPLHTIPYGQLGAVTNLSRDFATIKFNLRFEPRTDIELVRKTTKQIGLAMQDDPEMAGEIMLPLKLQGLAEVVDSAVVLRFKFTARPVKPSWVQREYMKRMYQVFAEKGIKFASGAVMLQTVPHPEAMAVDAAPAAANDAAAAIAGAVAAVEVAEIVETAAVAGGN